MTCALNQVAVAPGAKCEGSGTDTGTGSSGWCYVTGKGVTPGSTCSQAIAYTSDAVVPSGATINLAVHRDELTSRSPPLSDSRPAARPIPAVSSRFRPARGLSRAMLLILSPRLPELSTELPPHGH